MRLIDADELKKILENHKHYLTKDCDGWEQMKADLHGVDLRRANFFEVDLSEANLFEVDLRGADLRKTNLSEANLFWADLSEANLSGADLCMANLREADLRKTDLSEASLVEVNLRGADLCMAILREADLRKTDLSEANLSGADLSGADLRGTDLRWANLFGADLREADIFIPFACPTDGEFIAWKKVGDKLVKLRIPSDAKRCSATTNKCRCDKAFVEGIYNLDGTASELTSIENTEYNGTHYNVGEMVYPDSFDENRWNECSHGIHFFVDKESAIRY